MTLLNQLVRDMNRKIERQKERAILESSARPLSAEDKARLDAIKASHRTCLKQHVVHSTFICSEAAIGAVIELIIIAESIMCESGSTHRVLLPLLVALCLVGCRIYFLICARPFPCNISTLFVICEYYLLNLRQRHADIKCIESCILMCAHPAEVTSPPSLQAVSLQPEAVETSSLCASICEHVS